MSTSESGRANPRSKAASTATRKTTKVSSKAPVKRAVARSSQSATASAPKAAKPATRPAPAKRAAGKVAAKKPAAKKAPAQRASGTPARKRAKPDRQPDAFTRLRQIVATALDDLKARDTLEIDVRGKTSVTDLIVITSGTSSRHVKSIADEVVKAAKQAGLPPIGVEGQREAEWVLVDLGDIIVHVMLPRTREFYGLERLWTVGDADQPESLAG